MLTYRHDGENGDDMANQKNIPIGLWKKYRIVISGGLSNEHFVKAPNNTIARSMAKGELNPWIKIIRIEEVSAWKNYM